MSILTQALGRFARRALTATLSAGLPNSCILCGSDSRDVLCVPCIDDLPPLPMARCPLCAEPSAQSERCGHCLGQSPHFDATFALYRYDFPFDRLIHAFKYGGQLALAPWLGTALAEAVKEADFDLIIPLPLHPRRLCERGYNQSGEVAKFLARRLGRPLDLDHCRRSRATPPQAELPLDKRLNNVRGAFECSTDFSGLHILLVDDVMTTGATLDECARTLKLHGAARVSVAVAARALRQG